VTRPISAASGGLVVSRGGVTAKSRNSPDRVAMRRWRFTRGTVAERRTGETILSTNSFIKGANVARAGEAEAGMDIGRGEAGARTGGRVGGFVDRICGRSLAVGNRSALDEDGGGILEIGASIA